MGHKGLCIFTMLLFSTSAFGAKILISVGPVSYKAKGAKKKVSVKSGDKVPSGSRVSTGKEAFAVVELDNGAKLKLNANTSILVTDQAKADLQLYRGSVFTKYKKKSPEGRLRIKTRSAVSGVRGTEFFISYGSKKNPDDMWLCVNEGVVEVRALKSKKSVQVKAGEGISVKKDKGVSDPKALPWTKKLNWNMDPKKGELQNKVNIEAAYTDLLDEAYD